MFLVYVVLTLLGFIVMGFIADNYGDKISESTEKLVVKMNEIKSYFKD